MKMKQPKIWVISDTHFYHQGIVNRGVRSPFHNELTAAALQRLGPEDTLIHLGDVIFKHRERLSRIMEDCPARSKILCLGNHDYESTHWYLRNGFSAVMETFTLKYGGKNILFSHRPVSEETFGWQARFEEGELHLPQGADLNIHGHLHLRNHRDEESAWQDENDERWFLFSLEAVDYRPVLLDDILNGKIPRVLKQDALKYVHDPEKVNFDPIPKN